MGCVGGRQEAGPAGRAVPREGAGATAPGPVPARVGAGGAVAGRAGAGPTGATGAGSDTAEGVRGTRFMWGLRFTEAPRSGGGRSSGIG